MFSCSIYMHLVAWDSASVVLLELHVHVLASFPVPFEWTWGQGYRTTIELSIHVTPACRKKVYRHTECMQSPLGHCREHHCFTNNRPLKPFLTYSGSVGSLYFNCSMIIEPQCHRYSVWKSWHWWCSLQWPRGLCMHALSCVYLFFCMLELHSRYFFFL